MSVSWSVAHSHAIATTGRHGSSRERERADARRTIITEGPFQIHGKSQPDLLIVMHCIDEGCSSPSLSLSRSRSRENPVLPHSRFMRS